MVRPRPPLLALAAALLAALAPAPQAAQEGLAVTFVVNDATVEDQRLEGVQVLIAPAPGEAARVSGETDADGEFTCTLPAGTYAVTYLLRGYVPIADTLTTVERDGQLVTTTLSMMLEAEGAAGERRVRLILNWGSSGDQVRDADSHLLCPCTAPPGHVFYSAKEHAAAGHGAALDVDDTDWGGPETVTLHDPPPGSYSYWVYDYSGPPATLGGSEVVVRVLFGDTVAAEYRAPDTVTGRAWAPFKALVVGGDLRPALVPFSPEELAAGTDLVIPAGFEGEGVGSGSGGDSGCGGSLALFAFAAILCLLVPVVVRAARRARPRLPR